MRIRDREIECTLASCLGVNKYCIAVIVIVYLAIQNTYIICYIYIYKHLHKYWVQLLYVHIMVAEGSHSSRLSTCDTSVNIMHIM